jgi:UDP-N-acetylmuramoylalanine--D-glutamate ligase
LVTRNFYVWMVNTLNKALESYKKGIYGKKAAVLGFGISNRPLARILSKWGAQVTVFDKKEDAAFSEILADYKKLGIDFSLGENYLDKLKGFDVILRTPGMRFDIPQIQREVARGAELTSEMEVFFKLCPAFVYAVTGSDGKTTTTSLIYEFLKNEGYKCYLGGNIGTPLLDRIEEIEPEDKVVLELSSFQLQTMKDSPDVAVITNISPNHLDIHKSMEEYIDAKKNIFRHQKESDRLVLNYDNPITRGFISEAIANTAIFSLNEECSFGTFIRNNRIIYRENNKETEIIPISEIKLPGMYNVENIMAAITAVIPEVVPGSILKVAKTFGGVEHRNEFVRKIRDVTFRNNSIGSSPTRTIAALKTFDGNVILIAGGYDKNLSYDELGAFLPGHVKALVLMGATADKIEAAYMKHIEKEGFEPVPVFKAGNMEDAVKKAYSIAQSGDTVLLSPASASFDMYANFVERGNHFKEIVKSLE